MTVISIIGMIAMIGSCVNKPMPPKDEYVYRGQVPDSIVIHKADIEKIAELVHYRQSEIEYKRSENNLLLKVAGTVILLLLSGLMWFLRQMLATIPKLQGEVSKLSIVIATSEQWNKDQKAGCEERHRDLNEKINQLHRK